MASKTPPGDGKNNPFTRGQGGAAGKQTFDLQAGQGASATGKAPPFDQFAQSNPQAPAKYDTAQVPGGGIDVLATPHVNPGTAASATDIGTRTHGQAKSGFKLNG